MIWDILSSKLPIFVVSIQHPAMTLEEASNGTSVKVKMAANKNFIFSLMLLCLFVLSSCNNSVKSGKNQSVVADSAKEKAIQPELAQSKATEEDTVASGNFLNALRKAHKLYTGDFDTMMNRHLVRVLVPYSRTLFFNDQGYERGITAENFREFEMFINKKYRRQLHNIPITVIFIPTPRDELIRDVMAGAGDIAAGNLTITDERSKNVDFVSQKQVTVSEIVLNQKKDAPLTNADELSGKTVYVRQSSSYFESLQSLNKSLTANGKAPVIIDTVSENLEDEDLMDMLNAGIISTIVVDDWLAKIWAPVLPNVRLNDSATVRTDAHIGCAFRKNSPLLTAELNNFYDKYQKPLGVVPYRFKKYGQLVKKLYDPSKSDYAKRYNDIIALFQKYGKQYDFDPIMLAALGFQESKLNQNVRSHVGAIGVMQLMPATGSSMKVGDITVTENNIHAGAKYMSTIMNNYFPDAHFDEFNRALFAFASYNAGPNKIESLRKIAAQGGYNPDVWVGNVEVIASEKIGMETTTYVRNIIKYYYSYKLMAQRSEEQQAQREAY
jgi:membrane-bound lytic murein transglycosylase MltF